MNLNSLFETASFLRMLSMSCSGSFVFCVVVWPVLWFLIWAFLFLVWMVIFGSNPMNEYCASFFGPSIDSKR